MRVLAPGKLLVLGEYAVLDGAPAVVAAVDRGVACEVSELAVGGAIRIEVPEGGDDRFVRAALVAVAAPCGRYVFSAWRPVRLSGGAKPGLGGSAAATVAAVLAGHLAAGREVPAARRLAEGVAVHRAVQGSGSGIDVVASTLGGVLRVRSEPPDGFDVHPLPSLPLSVVYSGAPASTGPRVQRYLAWRERRAFVARSEAIVARFGADPIGALAEGGRLLRAMAEAAEIAYWTPGIDALVALAEAHGGAAKPSGAGGGDVVVALFERPEAQRAFEEAAQAAGYPPIGVSVAAGGAAVG